MEPKLLPVLMERVGKLNSYSKGEVFHSQDFTETLFMLKSGYVKRYQAKQGVTELIYGPGHIFPLSQLYKNLFNIQMNEQNLVYVYQAMTDISILRLKDKVIISELKKDPKLYKDLFYEAGLRLKANINTLASNALKSDYKKIAHRIVFLAEEFGSATKKNNGERSCTINFPLESKDLAEQLNIDVERVDSVLTKLTKQKLLSAKEDRIYLPDVDMLKDAYL